MSHPSLSLVDLCFSALHLCWSALNAEAGCLSGASPQQPPSQRCIATAGVAAPPQASWSMPGLEVDEGRHLLLAALGVPQEDYGGQGPGLDCCFPLCQGLQAGSLWTTVDLGRLEQGGAREGPALAQASGFRA